MGIECLRRPSKQNLTSGKRKIPYNRSTTANTLIGIPEGAREKMFEKVKNSGSESQIRIKEKISVFEKIMENIACLHKQIISRIPMNTHMER